MRDRRNFCKAAMATVIGLLATPFASAKPQELNTIHRYANGQWHRVRMQDLRPGDRFRMMHPEMDQPGYFVAMQAPYYTRSKRQWAITGTFWTEPPR